MKAVLLISALLYHAAAFSQDSLKITDSYPENIKLAEGYFKKGKFETSGNYYSLAFARNNGLGKVIDRYNAACSWVLANKADSAFFQLNRIATKGNFMDLDKLLSDTRFNVLHSDSRWTTIINQIKANVKEFEDKLSHGNISDFLDIEKQ